MNSLITVNCWELWVLSFCGWMSASETRRLSADVDPNNEFAVKKVLKERILPHLMSSERRPFSREQVRNSLRYFLTTKQFPVEDVFLVGEPPFLPPDNPLDYYRWAWEVLFGDEGYELESLKGYVEKNDRGAG